MFQYRRNTLFFVIIVCAMLFIPWLGDTYFYSKGEPREAVVAVSIIQSGDWILPVSQGADIPYKPPLLAWLIALFSMLFNHGHVNEFLARLPSAIAATAMLAATWKMVRRNDTGRMAWLTVIICATSFEVFRAAMACRVDMLLTACMVCGIYAMATMHSRPLNALWAILLLSGAVLTKGPVGALLPCLATGIYLLLDGRNFWRTFLSLTGVCLASFIIPAVWYWLAWRQGGQEFFDLAWEENIGRLTGTMSYSSHVNPWWYNFTSVLAGMLPWTLPVLAALCRPKAWRNLRGRLPRHGCPLLCAVAALTVFIFYCFPESKRAVYLLPCYPFMAYGAAVAVESIGRSPLMRGWTTFLYLSGILAGVAAIVLQARWIDLPVIAPLRPWLWPMALLPAALGLYELFTRRETHRGVASAALMTYALVMAYNAAFMPMALNAKSDVPAARAIADRVPDGAQLYGLIDYDSMLRYYCVNFYLDDRMRTAPDSAAVPDGAWLVTGEADPRRPAPDTLKARSCDTGRPILLQAPVAKTAPAPANPAKQPVIKA